MEEQKVNFFYIMHTDNLEGLKIDYIECKVVDLEICHDEINHMNNFSDGETSYTPLYLSDIETGKIFERFN